MKLSTVTALLAMAGISQLASGLVTSTKPCSMPATYTVVNQCTWNSTRHPTDYPGNAHWSPLCGTAHTKDHVIWKFNTTASDGVKQVAETGSCAILKTEVDTCRLARKCAGLSSFPCSPFSGTCTSTGTFGVTRSLSYVSFLTMVAPSPDWFAGISSVSLCKGGSWVMSYEKELNAYDGGTDGGSTFASSNNALATREPITRIDALNSTNIFYNTQRKKLYPLCKITLTLN